jgi:hypothetical protein
MMLILWGVILVGLLTGCGTQAKLKPEVKAHFQEKKYAKQLEQVIDRVVAFNQDILEADLTYPWTVKKLYEERNAILHELATIDRHYSDASNVKRPIEAWGDLQEGLSCFFETYTVDMVADWELPHYLNGLNTLFELCQNGDELAASITVDLEKFTAFLQEQTTYHRKLKAEKETTP